MGIFNGMTGVTSLVTFNSVKQTVGRIYQRFVLVKNVHKPQSGHKIMQQIILVF